MKIYITLLAKRKLELYANATDQEISGLGKVTQHADGNLWIDDVYIMEQKVSSGDTELDPEAVAKFINEVIVKGEDPAKLKLWWHSHGMMGAFWSTTDEHTAGIFKNGWMLSVVVNQRGEYKCRLDVYEPVHLVVDNIDMEVSLPFISEELKKQIEAEVKEKVRGTRSYSTYDSGRRDYDSGVGFHGTQRTLTGPSREGTTKVAEEDWEDEWHNGRKIRVWRRKDVKEADSKPEKQAEATRAIQVSATKEKSIGEVEQEASLPDSYFTGG